MKTQKEVVLLLLSGQDSSGRGCKMQLGNGAKGIARRLI